MFLAAQPNIDPILDLINTWIHMGQALVGSIGARVHLCVHMDVINTAV
jgi:hypothetical protein